MSDVDYDACQCGLQGADPARGAGPRRPRAPDPARAQAPPVDALRWESKGLAGLRVSVPARAVEYRPGPAGPRAAPALLLAGARRIALRRGGEGGRARRLQRSDINRLHAMEMAAATAAAATGPSIDGVLVHNSSNVH